MQHFTKIEKRDNADVGFIGDIIKPLNNEGCIGKNGIDKSFSLDKLINMAYEVNANIIIKSGTNAKWYLKKFPVDEIENEISKQSWRDVTRTTMWIIEWKKKNDLKDRNKDEYLTNDPDCPEWLITAEKFLNNITII